MSYLRRASASWLGINSIAVILGLLGASLGWALQGGSTLIPQSWPQIGILFVVARATNNRAWLGTWVVAATTFDWVLLGSHSFAYGVFLKTALGATMTAQILVASKMLDAVQGNPLHTRRGVFRLFLLSGVSAGIIGAILRLLLTVAADLSFEESVMLNAYRLSSHLAGIMVMAPLALQIWHGPKPSIKLMSFLEGWVLISLLLVVMAIASTQIIYKVGAFREVLILLILPFCLWGALRLGTWGAVIAVFAASIFPLIGTLHGLSPFGAAPGMRAEIVLQVFLVVTSVTTLTIAAMLTEKDVQTVELEEAKTTLEVSVLKRTTELRRERDFTSAILDTVGALIVVLSNDGRIVRFNRSCQQFTGKSFSEVEGKPLWEQGLIPEDEVEAAKESFQHATPRTHATHWIGADGSKRLFRWTTTRLPIQDHFTISVGLDVTDERRAQAEADEAIRARDDFLSVASHELKTPLTTLQLQVQSLLRLVAAGDLPKEDRLRRLDTLLRQTRRLADLVNQLLDVSRIMHGRIALDVSRVDLRELLVEMLDRYALEIEQSGSEVKVEGTDEEIVGLWDGMRIEQILANLISNAIKYGKGKPIEIRLMKEEDQARLIVRDHGIGISPEDQKRIFERFERAVSTRYYGGFGLGLWITRQVVEAHGGSIAVDSHLGEGSTFVVDLPLSPPEGIEVATRS